MKSLIILMLVFLSGSSFAQKYVHILSEDFSSWKKQIATSKDSVSKSALPKHTVLMVDGLRLPKGSNLSNYDSLYTVHYFRQDTDTMLVLAETYAKRLKSVDDLPENAFVLINNVMLQGKQILRLIGPSNYAIDNLSRYPSSYSTKTNKSDYNTNGEVIAHQTIPFLPQDFFLVKKYTLESIRYRCYSALPMLDFFSSADDGHTQTSWGNSIIFYVDGRQQNPDFDWQTLKPEDFKKVWVYSPTVATNFFGKKAQNGVIELFTQKSKLPYGHFLRGIRMIGEKQNKNGVWEIIADTTLASLEDYQAMRKAKLLEQGPIYIINGEAETEYLNRKTIGLELITDLYIRKEQSSTRKVAGKENLKRVYSDTVYIKTGNYNANFGIDRHTNPQIIIEELVKMRLPSVEETLPLYIIDDQEVTLEKLQKYRPKDFETVDVLDKTDAIRTYGKKGENGVVVYKLKKKI